MPRNDINIYLRAEAREALIQLTERWGVSRQEAIVRALIIAQAQLVALERPNPSGIPLGEPGQVIKGV